VSTPNFAQINKIVSKNKNKNKNPKKSMLIKKDKK